MAVKRSSTICVAFKSRTKQDKLFDALDLSCMPSQCLPKSFQRRKQTVLKRWTSRLGTWPFDGIDAIVPGFPPKVSKVLDLGRPAMQWMRRVLGVLTWEAPRPEAYNFVPFQSFECGTVNYLGHSSNPKGQFGGLAQL